VKSKDPAGTEPDAAAALQWRIADQIGEAYSIIVARADQELASEPVTTAEFVALVTLREAPNGVTQTAWARMQGVQRQRAHALALKLTAARLVEVRRHGRSSTVTLTDAGEQLISRLQPKLSAAYAPDFRDLSNADAKQLSALLIKFINSAADSIQD
jgi:DNA-binding MarR family transcriptional regulator